MLRMLRMAEIPCVLRMLRECRMVRMLRMLWILRRLRGCRILRMVRMCRMHRILRMLRMVRMIRTLRMQMMVRLFRMVKMLRLLRTLRWAGLWKGHSMMEPVECSCSLHCSCVSLTLPDLYNMLDRLLVTPISRVITACCGRAARHSRLPDLHYILCYAPAAIDTDMSMGCLMFILAQTQHLSMLSPIQKCPCYDQLRIMVKSLISVQQLLSVLPVCKIWRRLQALIILDILHISAYCAS